MKILELLDSRACECFFFYNIFMKGSTYLKFTPSGPIFSNLALI